MNKPVGQSPVSLETVSFPPGLAILVLAPHPDDFDAIGVTLRYFRDKGNPLHVVVATSGASGVEDSFCSPSTVEVKAALREEEQRASCKLFGLPEASLEFLRLEEDATGQPPHNSSNLARLRECLLNHRPAMVFLPHGHDTNAGHRRIYAMFRQIAQGSAYPLIAFLNRDPKTIDMRYDAYLGFERDLAAWKGELLRAHRSQHERNLNQRGHGLDDRILNVNRQSAEECDTGTAYAEVFELEFFGASDLTAFLEAA